MDMMDLSAKKGKRVCVAVSGGVDSMTLLFLLSQEAKTTGFSLCALTCDHGLRGKAAKEDVKLVEKYCKQLGVPLIAFSTDCNKLAKKQKCSVETAARNFRLECYEKVLQKDADCIATAHHENDEAETVLFRLARGSALTGAKGMSEWDGKLIRPFLGYSKAELYEIARQNGVPYREDETNATEEYTRNKIRLNILPELEYAVPGAVKNLARFARLAKEDDEFLYRLSSTLIKEEKGNYRVQTSEEKPLFTRACLTAMKSLGIEKDYTAKHLESLYALQSLQTGSKITLPQGLTAVKEYNEIVFYGAEKTVDNGGRYEVILSEEPFEDDHGVGKILRADKDKFPETAVIRTFQSGDEFRKFGGGNKSLKKYFIDEKIPLKERKKIPLIAEENSSRVYAVCGVEIADEIKIDETTKKTVYIKTVLINSTKE
jgi:tRNA(Ile)-lysidine synthase